MLFICRFFPVERADAGRIRESSQTGQLAPQTYHIDGFTAIFGLNSNTPFIYTKIHDNYTAFRGFCHAT